MQRKRGQARDGALADRKQPGTGMEPIMALTIVVRQLGLCGEGVGHRLVSGVVASALRRFDLSAFALFYPPCFFLVEQCSLSSLFFFFLFISQWHSSILRAGRNRLLFVSRWQASPHSSLLPHPPYNKAPPHKTKPIHQLADLRNG